MNYRWMYATFQGGQRYEYAPINLGSTIQAGESLYLAVVRDADQMADLQFVNALGEVLVPCRWS